MASAAIAGGVAITAPDLIEDDGGRRNLKAQTTDRAGAAPLDTWLQTTVSALALMLH